MLTKPGLEQSGKTDVFIRGGWVLVAWLYICGRKQFILTQKLHFVSIHEDGTLKLAKKSLVFFQHSALGKILTFWITMERNKAFSCKFYWTRLDSCAAWFIYRCVIYRCFISAAISWISLLASLLLCCLPRFWVLAQASFKHVFTESLAQIVVLPSLEAMFSPMTI